MRSISIGGLQLLIEDSPGLVLPLFDERLKRFAAPESTYPGMALRLHVSRGGAEAVDLASLRKLVERRLPTYTKRLYTDAPGNYYWVFSDWGLRPFAIFRCAGDFGRCELVFRDEVISDDDIFSLLPEMVSCFAAGHGHIFLHSVYLMYKGRAILLAAPSGTGKTTHANFWREAGYAEIVNGDLTLCGQVDGAWTAHGLPWCGSSPDCANRSAGIAAIVVMEQAPANRLDRLSAADALLYLLGDVLSPSWHPRLHEELLDLLIDLASGVPVFRLRCLPDQAAAHMLKQAIDRLIV